MSFIVLSSSFFIPLTLTCSCRRSISLVSICTSHALLVSQKGWERRIYFQIMLSSFTFQLLQNVSTVAFVALTSAVLVCYSLALLSREGNGTPLQYSCLENVMDGGAWWAAVHGISRSQTRLSVFTFTFHFHALEKEMATHSSVLAWRIPGREPGGLPSMGSHRVGHD